MPYDLPPKDQWPQPGFYQSYKHNPDGPIANEVFYICGIGSNKKARPEDQYSLIYLPLDEEAYVYRHGRMFDTRRLHEFFEYVEHKGVSVPRYTRITDPVVIDVLRAIKRKMYPPDSDE